MTRVLLVNPNTSAPTTEAMVAIAHEAFVELGAEVQLEGLTVARGPRLITDEAALAAPALEVPAAVRERMAAPGPPPEAVIVSAFGDPGAADVVALGLPTAAIAESAMHAAAAGGRCFGVATTTPGLGRPIAERACGLGLGAQLTGIRFTATDAAALAADPRRQLAELTEATRLRFDEDGAEAVVIGGGPLGRSARSLQRMLDRPVIAPIPAACAALLDRLRG